MNISLLRFSVIAFVIGLSSVSLSGCVVADGGYGYGGGGVGVGVDYYEPYGAIYGGWGPGYRVGPYRDGGRSDRGGGRAHAYRSAPASRSMPSIPSRSRGSR